MNQQNVPLLSRVVLLHAMVIGVALSIMQIHANVTATANTGLTMAAPAYIAQQKTIHEIPTSLSIPRIHINVPVIAGHYDTESKAWELKPDKAQYITGTSPNLTLLYGHNTAAVFELTNSLQVGDELILTSANGQSTTYTYISDLITSSSDTAVLMRAYSKPTVALLTCNGFWSQDRRFMFFEPVGQK